MDSLITAAEDIDPNDFNDFSLWSATFSSSLSSSRGESSPSSARS
jgi:hypothetical protein